MSLPLNYVVIGLIGITVAFILILNFTGNVQTVDKIIGGMFGSSERDIARSQCMSQKQQLCGTDEYQSGDTDWARAATYDGKSCFEWHQQEQIFGGDSDIPACE